MASKPWGGVGAWAAEAERAEAEEKERKAAAAAAAAGGGGGGGGVEPFPSLVEAGYAKPKRKKHQVLSLSEFTVGKFVGPGGKSRFVFDGTGLTTEEMVILPTGPRERSAEEQEYGGLGRGFRDYGVYRGEANANRLPRDRELGFGRGVGYGRELGTYRRDGERDGISRADENSNWVATKNFLPSSGARVYDDDRRGRRMGDRDLPSRADEDDNWGSSKKSLPQVPLDGYNRRGGRYQDRKESFVENRLPSRADEVDSWTAGKKFVAVTTERVSRSTYREAGASTDRWNKREPISDEPQRRRLILAPRTLPLGTSQPPPAHRGDSELNSNRSSSMSETTDTPLPPVSKSKSNPFGSARPREEVLAERGRDWRMDADYGSKVRDSRPSSNHASRIATSSVSAEVAVKPRPKINPFGDAKPREVLLQEKGVDWRKIDFELEHRAVDRPETEEEKKLKQDIQLLTQLAEQAEAKITGIVSEQERKVERDQVWNVREQILLKEKDLEHLVRTFDDRVRFSQRSERPGSQSGRWDIGRSLELSERPQSQFGQGESRAFESLERPDSHSGHGEGGRNFIPVGRPRFHSRWGESNRSFDLVERSWPQSWHPGSGRLFEHSRDAKGPEIWTRPTENFLDSRWSNRGKLDGRDMQIRF